MARSDLSRPPLAAFQLHATPVVSCGRPCPVLSAPGSGLRFSSSCTHHDGGVGTLVDPGRVVHNLPNGNFMQRDSIGTTHSATSSFLITDHAAHIQTRGAVRSAPYIAPPSSPASGLNCGWARRDMPAPDANACTSTFSTHHDCEGCTSTLPGSLCLNMPNDLSLPHSSSGLLLSTPSPFHADCTASSPGVGNFMHFFTVTPLQC